MKKNVEKAIVSGLIAVFVMSLMVGLVPFDLVPTVSAAGSKKAPIHINNTAGGALSYYQVNLNITYDSDMNNNFSDIRVKNETAGAFVPYWVEDKSDGAWCNLWFNATSIPASAWCNDTYYLYYGDAAASSTSSGNTTFEFFDDFEKTETKTKFENFEKYATNPLTIPLYEGNGVVHPDVLYFPSGIDGYKYWMVYTPYPPNSAEDPCIIRSNDGITWVNTSITNPVIDGTEDWRVNHQHDPDMLYISTYSKWFMVWGGINNSDDCSLAFAYSTDGKTWTEYDGTTVNGNTNPVILNSNDNGGQSWEELSNVSGVIYPTLFYDSGTFFLFYGEAGSGNNRGKAGYATFTWNNTTNDIENFQRYASNPVIDLSANSIFKSGCGHLDISYYDGTYYMYVVRELLGAVTYELGLLTSTDKINWVNQGKVLALGASGQWDDKYVYRASPVTDGVGNIILFSDEVKLYYSGYSVSTGYSKIGFANGSEGTIGVLDTDKWNITDSAGSASFANSIITLSGNAGLNCYSITAKNGFSPDTALRTKSKLGVTVESYQITRLGWCLSTGSVGATDENSLDSAHGAGRAVCGNGTSYSIIDVGQTHFGDWYTYDIIRLGSSTKFYREGNLVNDGIYDLNGNRYPFLFVRDSEYKIYSDWILVREYATPDPTASLGTEQTGGGAYEITLLSGWNIIGWTNSISSTDAENLGTDIGSNATFITKRNATTGDYETFTVGIPEINNFDVERGWGYYARVSAETVWNRTA